MYSLRRESDGVGDSGPMSMMLYPGGDHEYNARPKVGGAIRVGSIIARTFQHQDWWQTTMIQEILSETESTIRFKTRNSTYVWIDHNKEDRTVEQRTETT